MTFREYDKKMLNFCPGFKYWRTVLENKNEWDRQKPTAIGGNIILVDYYTKDEIEELKTTDRIAVSTYVQVNGPETDAYTEKSTAYEIRMALRERFENINTMGLTELTSRFYEVVKNKSHECQDEWCSDMLYLNGLIAKANGTKRTDAEILAHIISVAPREYSIPLSIISQNNINVKYALSRAQIELRNLEERQAKFKERNHNKSDSAYAFSGGKFKNSQGKNVSVGRGNGKKVGNKSWRKFKGHCKLCGMQGNKSTMPSQKTECKSSIKWEHTGSENLYWKLL
jgi:hypothetical protein